jgi:hypothetical protein
LSDQIETTSFNVSGGANPFAIEIAELRSLNLVCLAHVYRDVCKPININRAAGKPPSSVHKPYACTTQALRVHHTSLMQMRRGPEKSRMDDAGRYSAVVLIPKFELKSRNN